MAYSVLIGVVIGVTEEILWRGRVRAPFSAQHLDERDLPLHHVRHLAYQPQSVRSSSMPGGVYSFVFYAILLGLAYAYAARKTGSIRWCTLSHVIHDSLGLGALAYAIWIT